MAPPPTANDPMYVPANASSEVNMPPPGNPVIIKNINTSVTAIATMQEVEKPAEVRPSVEKPVLLAEPLVSLSGLVLSPESVPLP